MPYQFKSSLFRDDKLLEACAVDDAAHIWARSPEHIRRGKHVKKIQMVLAGLGYLIYNHELDGSVYSSSTSEAVFKFKSSWNPPIRRPGSPLDDIVGIQTIRALDKMQAQLEKMDPLLYRTFDTLVIYGQEPEREYFSIELRTITGYTVYRWIRPTSYPHDIRWYSRFDLVTRSPGNTEEFQGNFHLWYGEPQALLTLTHHAMPHRETVASPFFRLERLTKGGRDGPAGDRGNSVAGFLKITDRILIGDRQSTLETPAFMAFRPR